MDLKKKDHHRPTCCEDCQFFYSLICVVSGGVWSQLWGMLTHIHVHILKMKWSNQLLFQLIYQMNLHYQIGKHFLVLFTSVYLSMASNIWPVT